MKRKILLPTDFSKNAWSAISYAIKLYSKEECTFYLLNAWTFINSGVRTYITSSYIDGLKGQAAQNLTALKGKAQIESANPKHEFETIFSEDDFLDCVKETVKKHDIDIIVMGTKGSSGLSQILFGSNTVKLMTEIRSCPVLAIPEDFNYVTPRNIAFPTDFKCNYGNELASLKELSKLHNSKIKIVNVNLKKNLSELQNDNLKTLKTHVEEHPNSFHWVEEIGNKHSTINYFIDEFNIDILAMINYKHSFIENLVKEPIVKKIGFNPKVPFFVISNLD